MNRRGVIRIYFPRAKQRKLAFAVANQNTRVIIDKIVIKGSFTHSNNCKCNEVFWYELLQTVITNNITVLGVLIQNY